LPYLHSFPTRRSSDLFRRFDVDGTYRLATATHSPARRSVTILAFFPERTWSIEPECVLSLGSSDSAQPFSCDAEQIDREQGTDLDRKSTRLNSSHVKI